MSGRLTPQYEAEIRERAEAATPGPWWTEILPEHGGESIGIDAPGDNWIVPVQDLYEPNAEFMGHAREDVPALLAEIERQRAELAAVRAERDEVAVEVARFGIYGTATSAAKALVARASELVDENASLRAECDEAQRRVAELEKVAVEARAALGSLCYDLEDPGSNALGALYLLSQATTWTDAKPDDALRVLAQHDASVREVALREAEGFASELFDAADERGDRAGADMAEQIADRLSRIADGAEAGERS